MRYSEIIGKGFYRIALSPDHYMLLDVHFSGASHHLYRFREAFKTDPSKARFHLDLHRAHLRNLMEIVHDHGRFDFAKDASGRKMDQASSWDPEFHPTPDPDMFGSMLPDMRYELGLNHPYDQFIESKQVKSHNVVNMAFC